MVNESSEENEAETSATFEESGQTQVVEAERPIRSLDEIYDELFEALTREDSETGVLTLIEHAMVIRALESNGGNQVKASQILGMTRTTLRKRIEQNDIKVGV